VPLQASLDLVGPIPNERKRCKLGIYKGLLERHFERLFAEIVYSFLFAIYGVILAVWYTIYSEIQFNLSRKDSTQLCFVRFSKCILKVRIVLVFAIQIAVSLLKGVRTNQDYRYFIYSGYTVLYINFM
jgi:hypothetical protein